MSEIKVGIGAKLNASFQSTVEKVKQGVRETVAETKKIAVETGKISAQHAAVEAGFSVMGFVARRALAAILPSLAGVLGGLGLVLGSVKILSGTMWLLERATGAVNAGLTKFGMTEDLATKLRPITGSVEAAKTKLRELAGVIKGTNISLPDAVTTYRSTQVQTGGALSDRKGLTMLGDVAAASGNSITETADAVGKLYGDLQSGQPIDDATNKLREMGIISGDVQKQIYLLVSQGKSGAEVWQMLTGEFQKSSGAMVEARDNLTSLQDGLAKAKDTLYSLFAEDSAPEAKGRLKAQTKVLEDLQPAAKEAGSLFAALKGIWGDTSTQLNRLYDWVLSNVGSLKAWVDVAFVAVVAATAFAAATLLAVAPLAVFGTLTVATLGTIGLLAAAVAAVAGSLFIYAHHLNEVNERQMALMRGTDEVVAGLRKQRNELASVTDKAVALAKAYDQLKNAREALANAKTGKEKEEFRFREQAVQAEIRALERVDDSKLKGSAARQKSEQDLKDAQGERSDFTDNPEEKLASASSTAEEARAKRQELQEKFDELQGSMRPRGSDSDATLNAEIAKAQAIIKSSRQREKDASRRAEMPENGADSDALQGQVADEQGVQAAQQKRINDLLAQKAGRTQRLETARTEIAAQDVVVEKTGTDELKAQKANAAYQDSLAQISAEREIAALQGEGIDRMTKESDIRLSLIESRWKEAEAAKDTLESERQRLAYYQEQVRHAKEVEAVQSREKEHARELATAQGERQNNNDKRAADAALAEGKITPEQRRAMAVDELRKKQQQAYSEAKQMEAEAAKEKQLGHDDRAAKLATDAVRRREQGDTFGFDAADLSRAPAAKPVADSLARLGLGGNVSPLGKDPSLAVAEKSSRTLDKILDAIKERNNPTGPKPGIFGR